MSHPLIEIRDLHVDYRTSSGQFVQVLRGIDLDIGVNESVALVGESGSGKTTLALTLLRLLPRLGVIRSGSITYHREDGTVMDIGQFSKQELRRFRWSEISIVYQSALNSLNPLLSIREQFRDTARAHRGELGADRLNAHTRELLQRVRLEPDQVLSAFPHQLSGGMRQRVAIALSMLLEPRLIILDEPTTALDVLTQRSIIEMLGDIRSDSDLSMLFVSHDLPVMAELADRIATMYAGEIIEYGSVDDIFYTPRHPYTRGLLRAIPSVSGDVHNVASIPGSPPGFGSLPPGCPFHPRCEFATDTCRTEHPNPVKVETDHWARCFHTAAVAATEEEVSR